MRHKARLPASLLIALAVILFSFCSQAAEWRIDAPASVLKGKEAVITVTPPEADGVSTRIEEPEQLRLSIGGSRYVLEARDGQFVTRLHPVDGGFKNIVLLERDTELARTSYFVVSGWLSVFPALIAIALALILRNAVLALMAGIWFGAWTLEGFGVDGLFVSFFRVLDSWVIRAIVPEDGSTDHAFVLLFTLVIGGMMGIVQKNGGMTGIGQWLASKVRSARGAQCVTGFCGLVIFFDDYANTLVVGNTMRSLCDRMRVSRAKLAYIVDSTSAPVVCLAFISTWIGFEVSLVDDALDSLGATEISAYNLFLAAIPYSFYPILAIIFLFMVTFSGRDFGPMLESEYATRRQLPETPPHLLGSESEEEEPEESAISRIWLALVPVLVLIGGTITGLFMSGDGDSIADIIGSSDPFRAILWGALAGTAVAVILTLVTRAMTGEELFESWLEGLHSMVLPIVILTLAWGIANINDSLETAQFLVGILEGGTAAQWLPLLTFIVAAMVAFSTGTSWGTMAILMPLVMPLVWTITGAQGSNLNPDQIHLVHAAIAAVLAGAVWGDHCSPISDSTILSAMASGCGQIEHFRTQMPYALTVGAVSCLIILITSYGVPWWLGILMGAGVLYGILRMAGRRLDTA